MIQQATLLTKMRAQYYDMSAAGAKAFSCKGNQTGRFLLTRQATTPSDSLSRTRHGTTTSKA